MDRRGLLVAETEAGICRVMCFSPRHDLTLATMEAHEIEPVIREWSAQTQELSRIEGIHHVQIFENRGEMMGASNPHPHCQIWATATVPQAPARELFAQRNYRDKNHSCLLCEYVELEEIGDWDAFRTSLYDWPGPCGYTRRVDVFKPIIAAVNGYAFAAGLETALLADIRIGAENAEFGALERRWNIVGGDGLTARLVAGL